MAKKNNEQIEDILETFDTTDQHPSLETRLRMLVMTTTGNVIVGC